MNWGLTGIVLKWIAISVIVIAIIVIAFIAFFAHYMSDKG